MDFRVFMPQQNLVELARSGNPKAIAALLNRNLQKHNITAKVDVKGDRLKVLFESHQVPDQARMYAFMQKGMESLKPENINKVNLYGKAFDQDFYEWEQRFEIQKASEIQLSSAEEVADKIRDIAKTRTVFLEAEYESPFLQTQKIEKSEIDNSAYCPNCGSSHLQIRKDTNVSWGRAVVGWALFGTVGGAVGAITGEDRNSVACLNCGTSWKAKDLYKIRETIREMTGKILNLSQESDRIYINKFITDIGPYIEAVKQSEKEGDKLVKEKEAELDKNLSEGCANGCSWSIGLALMGLFTIASGGLLLIPIAIALPFILANWGKRKDSANKKNVEGQIEIAKKEAEKLKLAAENTLNVKLQEFVEYN